MPQTRRGGCGGLPLIGLDVGRHSIKMARLDVRGRSAHLVALGKCYSPPGLFDDQGCFTGSAALAGGVCQLARELGIGRAEVFAAVSGPGVPVLSVSAAPGVDPVATLRAECPAAWWAGDEALFATQAHGAEGELIGYQVAVSARRTVAGLVAGLEEAGLVPTVIDTAPYAVGYALSAADGNATTNAIAVDIGVGHATAMWLAGGAVQQVAVEPAGTAAVTGALMAEMGVSYEIAEAYRTDWLDVTATDPACGQDDPPSDEQAARAWAHRAREAVEPVFAQVAGLIERLQAAATAAPPEALWLLGGGTRQRGLAWYLAERCGLPARPADAWAALAPAELSGLPPEIVHDPGSYVVCLGLALRPSP